MRYLFFLVILAAGAYVLITEYQPAEAPQEFYYVSQTVRRGDLEHVLRETGMLFPKEPVVLKSNHEGNIKWVIEEGSWVEKGEVIYILSDDEELKRVTELRTRLLNARQELKLARMKRSHASEVERRKLAAALRAYDLESIRHRILNTTPKGGGELIRIHEALVPLEKATRQIRDEYENAQFNYQKAQDKYLDALDAWQGQRDRILQVQAKIDEFAVDKEKDPEKLQQDELKKYRQNMEKLAESEKELESLRSKLPEFTQRARETKAMRDETRPPRDKSLKILREREQKEKELFIRLEIEKRGVELEKLKYDEEIARLNLAEARRKYENGKKAFESGAMSRAALEGLEAKMKGEESKLKIVEQKIKIAERPPEPEVLAEAKMKLQRAKASAESAKKVHDRALKILDTEIALLEARVEKLESDIEHRSADFPALIESNMDFARKELALLEEDETERRKAIEDEIKRLESRLETAKENPPNVARTPVSGIVELREYRGRPIQAGDQVDEQDANAMVYPPQNMEVMAKVNEVNLQHIEKGMKVIVTVPALNIECSGAVHSIAGVGKDKFADYSKWWKTSFADVTQFDIRVSLDKTYTEFRQGMTVMVKIALEERDDVTWLPAGVVSQEGKAFAVLVGSPENLQKRKISGAFFGDDWFVIDKGLAEGETVLTKRRRNE